MDNYPDQDWLEEAMRRGEMTGAQYSLWKRPDLGQCQAYVEIHSWAGIPYSPVFTSCPNQATDRKSFLLEGWGATVNLCDGHREQFEVLAATQDSGGQRITLRVEPRST